MCGSFSGNPIVLILFTGRPLTLQWEHENIPAILNVWFGGTQSGNAIADAVFGHVNPSGKLPATFPLNVGQIPVYYNHKNTGRPLKGEWFQKFRSNYLDIPNNPLYPFGFGLSYTTFSYEPIKLSANELNGNDTLLVSVTLKNTGNYAGAEVVQVYLRDVVGSITRPVKELKGFKKVFLDPGEERTIQFKVSTTELCFYNDQLKFDWEPGEFVVMIGGNSRDVQTAGISWNK